MQELIQDPVFFWLFLSIAAVAGILFGWESRAFLSERPLAKALERSEQERHSIARLFTHLKLQHEIRETDLRKAVAELGYLRERIAGFEVEKAVLNSQHQATSALLEKAEANAQHFGERVRLLADQAQELRQRNQELASELARLQEELKAWKTLHRDFSGLQARAREYERASLSLETERNQLRQQLESARMEIENLQSDLLQRSAPDRFRPSRPQAPPVYERQSGPSHRPEVPEPADDLKIIRGLTSALEQQLNTLGIFTFAQISRWDDNAIIAFSRALGISPGKMYQDDWVGQARQLLGRYKG